MSTLNTIYKTSLCLLTDFYQLTMAYAYWKSGMAEYEGVFHVFFRENPFQGGYAVAAGLEYVADYLNQFQFTEDDLVYLKSLKDSEGKQIFEDDFLTYLKKMKFNCDVHAVPEGTVVFPQEPLLRVTGPLLQCQLLETPILNMINFQTLIATKAARIAEAAQGEPILEFGLRRAQGIDGGLSASRSAYIGGCAATSNTLAGKILNIPVRGTHAHSWVMSFEDELESFFAFAKAMPDHSVFLVDTYNTLQGVRNAVEVGKWLKTQGKELVGIRLDSGDLAYLSIEARKILDEAGFEKTQILASNDLNEKIISSLKTQGSKIGVWGVGTQLVTAFDQPALGAVYKLTAIRKDKNEPFEHRMKLSEQVVKISTPGILQIRRFFDEDFFVSDMIFDELTPLAENPTIVDPKDSTRFRTLSNELKYQDLLVPIFRQGKCVYEFPTLLEVKNYVSNQVNKLHVSIRRLMNPHSYPAGLEKNLSQFKIDLILKNKEKYGR